MIVQKYLSTKKFQEIKNSPTFFCCFYMKVTLLKILGQSNKFVRSYNFLKCFHWVKIEVEKEPSLRKQTPPSSTSPRSGPISVWIRLLPFNFRSLEYSQTTLQCNFRAMFALGPMVKLINFQGCGNQRTKRQPRVENQTGRLKEKKKRLPFSGFQWEPGSTPYNGLCGEAPRRATEPTINIESLWCVAFLNLSRTL